MKTRHNHIEISKESTSGFHNRMNFKTEYDGRIVNLYVLMKDER